MWVYGGCTILALISRQTVYSTDGVKSTEGVLNYYTGNYSMLEEGMIERAERYRRSLSNNIKSDVDSYYYIRKNDLGLEQGYKESRYMAGKSNTISRWSSSTPVEERDLVNRRWLKRPTGKGKNKKYWIGDNCAKTCDEEQTQLNKVTDRSHT